MKNEQAADGMCDAVTERGNGTFRESDGALYITYKNDNATVFIKAESDSVSVKRRGESVSDIKYRLGKRSYFEYKTQYGSLAMSVFTKSIAIGEKSIRLAYTLQTGNDEIMNNILITWEVNKC